MKKDNIIIDGKVYLTTRRGAEIAGYSADYVGQLCRSQKVVSRMIGRTWYVEKDSILKHSEETFKANHTSFKPEDFKNVILATSELKSERATIIKPRVRETVQQSASQPTPSESTSSVTSTQISSQTYTTPVKSSVVVTPSNKPFIIAFTFLLVVAIISFNLALQNSSRLSYISQIQTTPNVESHGNKNFLASANSFIHFTFSSLLSIFSTNQTIRPFSANYILNTDESNSGIDNLASPQAGLVVVPSSSSDQTNRKLANTISNSFSDPVTVAENRDSNTGVITPVFRTVKGHDFMYVLVPVKASSTTTN